MTEISSFQYLKTTTENYKEQDRNFQSSHSKLLCVVVNDEKLYIDINSIKKVIIQPEITELANTNSWFAGLIRSDGDVYSANHIDQIIYHNINFINNTFAVVLNDNDNIALLVKDVIGIAKIKQLNNKTSSQSQYIDLFENENKQILKLINTDKLISSKEFRNPSLI